MADDGPPPLDAGPAGDPAHAGDPGSPRFAWFDGIVEGRLGDAATVRSAASRANQAGFARMDVSVDGGRFSVLMDESTILPAKMTDENRRVLASALDEIAGAAEGPLESTLRCTEVFANQVRETIFLPGPDGIRALTRTRPVAPGDLYRDPASPEPPPSMGRGRLAIVLAALLVAFGLIAWITGWTDRLFSAKAEAIAVDAGPFANFIEVSVERNWGDYDVRLRRGAGFPVESERLAELRAKAATPAERAALEAVATGGTVWLRLEDAEHHRLAVRPVELRPLVARADGEVKTELPGRIAATRLCLDLEAGPDPK